MLCHRLGSGDRTAGDTPLNLVWDVLASSEMCVLPLCLRDHCHVSFASQTAAVSQHGTVRDRTLPIVALHTGLRAEELCRLKREHVHLGRRSAHVSIYGKRNKFREVPLNSTARNALASYMQSLPSESAYLSPSRTQARRV